MSIHLHVYMYMCFYGLFCNFVVVGDCRWRAPSCMLPHGVHHRCRGASLLPNAARCVFRGPANSFWTSLLGACRRVLGVRGLVLAFFFGFGYWLGLFCFFFVRCWHTCYALAFFCSSLRMFCEIFSCHSCNHVVTHG